MKKQVPFKKEIDFDTNIDEINSISLEYEITEKKEGLIAGKFTISGDYRMTSTSPNLDVFNYELPFNINIDKKYNIDDSKIDISNFYYEVINNKILSVNIELEVDKVEERKKMERCIEKEDIVLEEQEDNSLEEVKKEEVSTKNNMVSIFDSLDDNETYTTYKIHIIRENDTIDGVIADYNITREKLEDYNNLSDIKLGDKLIIPANEN